MQIALKTNSTTHLPFCEQLKDENNDTNFSMFREIITDTEKEFQDRFQNFDSLKRNNSMGIERSEVPCKLQMKICDT